MTPQIAALMAGYNLWMNDRLFDAAGKLDDADLAADKEAFFGPIPAARGPGRHGSARRHPTSDAFEAS